MSMNYALDNSASDLYSRSSSSTAVELQNVNRVNRVRSSSPLAIEDMPLVADTDESFSDSSDMSDDEPECNGSDRARATNHQPLSFLISALHLLMPQSTSSTSSSALPQPTENAAALAQKKLQCDNFIKITARNFRRHLQTLRKHDITIARLADHVAMSTLPKDLSLKYKQGNPFAVSFTGHADFLKSEQDEFHRYLLSMVSRRLEFARNVTSELVNETNQFTPAVLLSTLEQLISPNESRCLQELLATTHKSVCESIATIQQQLSFKYAELDRKFHANKTKQQQQHQQQPQQQSQQPAQQTSTASGKNATVSDTTSAAQFDEIVNQKIVNQLDGLAKKLHDALFNSLEKKLKQQLNQPMSTASSTESTSQHHNNQSSPRSNKNSRVRFVTSHNDQQTSTNQQTLNFKAAVLNETVHGIQHNQHNQRNSNNYHYSKTVNQTTQRRAPLVTNDHNWTTSTNRSKQHSVNGDNRNYSHLNNVRVNNTNNNFALPKAMRTNSYQGNGPRKGRTRND